MKDKKSRTMTAKELCARKTARFEAEQDKKADRLFSILFTDAGIEIERSGVKPMEALGALVVAASSILKRTDGGVLELAKKLAELEARMHVTELNQEILNDRLSRIEMRHDGTYAHDVAPEKPGRRRK
jgi:hypothetical protein